MFLLECQNIPSVKRDALPQILFFQLCAKANSQGGSIKSLCDLQEIGEFYKHALFHDDLSKISQFNFLMLRSYVMCTCVLEPSANIHLELDRGFSSLL